MSAMNKNELTRRRFMLTALTAGCGCLLAPLALPSRAWAELEASYFLIRSQGLLTDFKKLNGAAQKYLSKTHGKSIAQEICAQAPSRFSALIPKLPYIGGRGNMDTMYLILSSFLLAYHQPFSKHGLGSQELGRMFYEVQKRDLEKMPRRQAQVIGSFRFSQVAQQTLKQWCDWTQKKSFSHNWVANFVPGDGKGFDFGYDISKCAVVSFYRANGARPLAPYFCLTDFLRSKALGTGLGRSQTIAQGDTICNFRYKKGRLVTQGWDSEVPKFIDKKFS